MRKLEIQIVNKIDEKFIKEWQETWKVFFNRRFYSSCDWFLTSLKIFSINKYLIFVIRKLSQIKLIFVLLYEKRFDIFYSIFLKNLFWLVLLYLKDFINFHEDIFR